MGKYVVDDGGYPRPSRNVSEVLHSPSFTDGRTENRFASREALARRVESAAQGLSRSKAKKHVISNDTERGGNLAAGCSFVQKKDVSMNASHLYCHSALEQTNHTVGHFLLPGWLGLFFGLGSNTVLDMRRRWILWHRACRFVGPVSKESARAESMSTLM